MWWTWLALAFAVPPSAEVVEGEIVARVTVAAAPDVARAKVTDPAWITEVEGGGSATRLLSRDDACGVYENTTPGPFTEVVYTTRQCPTPEGSTSTLVASNTFTRYAASWRVVPDGAGSLVEYRIALVTRLPMPQSWVDNTTRKRLEALMQRVQERLAAP